MRGSHRSLLVDAGLGVAPLRPALPHLLTAEPVLVITHGHLDHMGGAHEFTDVRAHPGENIQAPHPGSLLTADLFTELGMPPIDDTDVPELMISARPHDSYDPTAYRLRGTPVSRTLDDGDVIDLGDRRFTVLHLPGHSPGSIGLFDPDNGTLFSGDVIYDDQLLDDIHGADPARYVTTMARLRDLPVTVCHPGHGPSFDATRLREIADAYITDRS
ncbi:MBL fold metallo-hydrolase [Streptomyces scabiei]|uniref:MBL fold metallo-hydrolase n=1 Tax=Streptomyces scabiei TaxID=1930 RepID=UPI00298F404B|nr:MBL fold metallo-hydrolase [Streptomyces scabiei]MDW8803599.1 MBL fold metallo-hydrolase [Streptomyces scabiei]